MMTCDFIFLRGFLIRTRFCDRRRRTKLLDSHGNNSYIHVHSLKFYRLRRSRRRYTVKYQRKPCKIDAAVLGVSRPLHTRYFSMERILVIMLEITVRSLFTVHVLHHGNCQTFYPSKFENGLHIHLSLYIARSGALPSK